MCVCISYTYSLILLVWLLWHIPISLLFLSLILCYYCPLNACLFLRRDRIGVGLDKWGGGEEQGGAGEGKL